MDKCQCEASGFCTVRNLAMKPTLQMICKVNKNRVDRLLDPTVEKTPPDKPTRQARPAVLPKEPVGDCLEARIEGLIKVKSSKGCGCSTLKSKMNSWGVRGCERNRPEIVSTLVANRDVLLAAVADGSFIFKTVLKNSPDDVLAVGANWLLDGAIDDARAQKNPGSRSPQKLSGYCSAVTSMNPNPARAERQLLCLRSWLQVGLNVVVVNTAEELDGMDLPAGVTTAPCDDMTTIYDRKTQFVSSLIQAGIDTGHQFMLINSDIEIDGNASLIDKAMDHSDSLTIGIRHNYYAGRRVQAVREPSGLDVFLMTPELARTIPDAPFGIGKPAWDYWLPLHFKLANTPFHWIKSPLFYHEKHPLGWSRSEWELGRDFLIEYYGVELGYGSGEFRASLDTH